MKTILLLLILNVFSYVYAPIMDETMLDTHRNIFLAEKLRKQALSECLQNIKEQESLVLHSYNCPAGYKTIGYGHAIKKGEQFSLITEEQADSLLSVDFEERFIQVTNLHPELDYVKRLAIAHFVYNVGIGTYLKSKLFQAVNNNHSIDNLIVRYCYYKKNGEWIKSNHILNSRNFELKLWNYESPIN